MIILTTLTDYQIFNKTIEFTYIRNQQEWRQNGEAHRENYDGFPKIDTV